WARRSAVALAALLVGAWTWGASPAAAYPLFAHRYGVSCQTCHSVVPRLNAFGERFKAAGYRWPGKVETHDAFPVTVKVNLAYTSEPDPGGLPKALADEVELLSAGPLGRSLSYHLEQYLADGGVPGKTRDAWVAYDSDPQSAWSSRGARGLWLHAQLGQFTLPLPNDPETFRPTANHYAVFDQTVGANPFNLFNDGMGIEIGVAARGGELQLMALKGHDPQSGLPTQGTDRMATLRLGSHALSVSGYRYEGTRPLGPIGDRFWRTGWALSSIVGKSRASLLLQTGNDTSADGLGTEVASSGGYVQEEWAFSPRLIGVARYDGLSGAGDGFMRSTTVALVFRPYRRARFTIEEVLRQQPRPTNTLNLGWLFAY
ncbi:MAG: hypothetical protein KGM44_04950, partial [bacterium]|nr:hypothetical protein [bacterium]